MVGLLAPGAAAQPTPQDWTQFQADPSHRGAADGPSPPYAVAWELPVEPEGEQGLSAPVVSETLDLVVAVSRTAVIGVDLTSGRKLWEVERAAGPPVSPAIVRLQTRSLLLYTEGGAAGTEGAAEPGATTGAAEPGAANAGPPQLTAIDLRTREPAWDSPLDLEATSRTGVTIEGATAFVGDERGNVIAVDAARGERLWTASVEGSRLSLAVAGDRVLLSTPAEDTPQPEILALSAADGSEAWRTGTEVAGLGTSIPSATDEAVVVGFADGSVQAFRLADGTRIWESERLYSGFSPLTSIAIDGSDAIAADASGDVRRLGGDSGERSWDFALNQGSFRSSPVLSGATVLLGLGDGSIAAIDGATGVLVWRSDPGAGPIGPIAVASDSFVAVRGGTGAGLVAFEADPGGTLSREQSPTVTRWGQVLGWWAIAAIGVGLVLTVPARIASRTLGPSQLGDAQEWGEDGGDSRIQGDDLDDGTDAEPEPPGPPGDEDRS